MAATPVARSSATTAWSIEMGEACDDGNEIDTDAGSTAADLQGGYGPRGQEECDDGKRDNFDACLNACTARAAVTAQRGWICRRVRRA